MSFTLAKAPLAEYLKLVRELFVGSLPIHIAAVGDMPTDREKQKAYEIQSKEIVTIARVLYNEVFDEHNPINPHHSFGLFKCSHCNATLENHHLPGHEGCETFTLHTTQ